MRVLKTHDLTGHDVFEFMQGQLADTHWKEDSIYLTEEAIAELVEYLYLSFKNFNYYGPTEVTEEMWEFFKLNAAASDSDDCKQFVHEVDQWAQECFKTHACFTICGI